MRQLIIALLLSAIPCLAQNLSLTPGRVRPLSTVQVCSIKWGRDRRHVTAAMKRQVCSSYGIDAKDCTGAKYEIDHLIPRELGGADDVRNLWPQPWIDAHDKDRVENYLHREVCAGRMTLAVAQKAAITWKQTWTQMFIVPAD